MKTQKQKSKELFKIETKKRYTIPSKEDPVFLAECSHFGYIEGSPWRDAQIDDCRYSVFAINYHDAIVDLHKWIVDQEHLLKEYPRASWRIWMLDGSWERDGYQHKMTKVYTISSAKAKKYLFQNIIS